MRLLAVWFGVSRTALYKSFRRAVREEELVGKVLDFVDDERESNKKMGGVKLHRSFCDTYPEVSIGRDRFLRYLRENNRLLRRRRCYRPKKQPIEERPDLTRGLELTRPEQLWVHDDTIVQTRNGRAHLALSTDAHSSRIMGYSWARRADTEHVSKAFRMAISAHSGGPEQLIHHSDNGSIYASRAYRALVERYAVMSWSPPGRPDRNAKAERVNLTFKQEYLCDSHEKTFEEIARDLPDYIRHYNERRPHMSCNYSYPSQVHEGLSEPRKLWKQRPRSYDSPKG